MFQAYRRHLDKPWLKMTMLASWVVILGVSCIEPPSVNDGQDFQETIPAGDELLPGLVRTDREMGRSGDGTGAFRTECTESHVSFDDPLVFPGQPGATHEHIFFGNPDVDAFTTVENLRMASTSTCQGGALNLSAYWVPSIRDAQGERVEFNGPPLFYYKSGFHIPATEIQAPPEGLAMIAGHSHATTAQSTEAVKYRCESWEPTTPQFDEGDPLDHVPYIPDCDPGDLLEIRIVFPQCWDGVNLSSDDFHAHMAYPIPAEVPHKGTGRCPASHPVPIPEIAYNFSIWITEEMDSPSSWRLSSDNYPDDPGGYSTHADWMNGWHPDIMDRIVSNCINAEADCGVGLLGDGTQLEELDEG